MRQPLVAGNWKMNGSRDSVKALLDGLKAGIGDVTTAEGNLTQVITDNESQLEQAAELLASAERPAKLR